MYTYGPRPGSGHGWPGRNKSIWVAESLGKSAGVREAVAVDAHPSFVAARLFRLKTCGRISSDVRRDIWLRLRLSSRRLEEAGSSAFRALAAWALAPVAPPPQVGADIRALASIYSSCSAGLQRFPLPNSRFNGLFAQSTGCMINCFTNGPGPVGTAVSQDAAGPCCAHGGRIARPSQCLTCANIECRERTEHGAGAC